MNTHIPHKMAGAVAAALCAATLGACSSTSGPSASSTSVATTTPSTSVSTTTGAGTSTQADTVCSDIKSTISALGNLDLNSPNSIQAQANTVANDISRLSNDVSNHSFAPSGSPEQTMANDVRQAINEGQTAASQLAHANAGNAKSAFQAMTTDLNNARSAGAKAKLSNCT